MTELKRYTRASGTAGQPMPFARAVQADGWLHVSGQTPLRDGVLVDGGIVPQARQCLNNLLEILDEAGYRPEHVVRCGVWLDDPRDFGAFNAVFLEFFGDHPPARACVVSSMVIEVDCIAYRAPEGR